MPWGASQYYGGPLALTAQGGADVACAAGVETNVLSLGGVSNGLLLSNPDTITAFIIGILTILLGATPPTSILIKGQMNANGGPTFNVPPALLVANATLMVPLGLFGGSSKYSPGQSNTIQVTLTAAAQAVTVKQVGSLAYAMYINGGV